MLLAKLRPLTELVEQTAFMSEEFVIEHKIVQIATEHIKLDYYPIVCCEAAWILAKATTMNGAWDKGWLLVEGTLTTLIDLVGSGNLKIAEACLVALRGFCVRS